jgi:PIN domain nuclease of toxin-antitoxin system
MIHLDTHVLVWLHKGKYNRFPKTMKHRINTEANVVSPMVILELQYLFEIGRANKSGQEVINRLQEQIELSVSNQTFHLAALKATELSWTRDPFDRLIAAHAIVDNCPLLTADEVLLKNCSQAIWE